VALAEAVQQLVLAGQEFLAKEIMAEMEIIKMEQIELAVAAVEQEQLVKILYQQPKQAKVEMVFLVA
jgi:hypothetical protein